MTLFLFFFFFFFAGYFSIFPHVIDLKWLWKMLFISSKKLFSFSKYSNLCISVLALFSPVGHCFKGWSKTNFKVYDVNNCLNRNLITHFGWYLEKKIRYAIETSIDRIFDITYFHGNIMQKKCYKASPRPRFNFGNNPKFMQEIL